MFDAVRRTRSPAAMLALAVCAVVALGAGAVRAGDVVVPGTTDFPESMHATSDGTLYFTNNNPNTLATIGKVDAKTGEVTWLKVDTTNGRTAAGAHGLVRDGDGNFWFDVNPGRRSLGKLDTKTDNVEVFIPPQGMAPTGGATTVDYDGQGFIWVSSPTGALRFDPVEERFAEYKSPTQRSATTLIVASAQSSLKRPRNHTRTPSPAMTGRI